MLPVLHILLYPWRFSFPFLLPTSGREIMTHLSHRLGEGLVRGRFKMGLQCKKRSNHLLTADQLTRAIPLMT